MTDDHSRQAQSAERARPAAIQCGDFAEHPQVKRGDEQNIECGSGRDGGQKCYSSCRSRNQAQGILVKEAHKIALGELDAIVRSHNGIGMDPKPVYTPSDTPAAPINANETLEPKQPEHFPKNDRDRREPCKG